MSFLDEPVPSEQAFFSNSEEQTHPISQSQDCRSYFQALPWTVKKSSFNDNPPAKVMQNPEPLQTNQAVISDMDFLRQLDQETEKITKFAPDSQNYF
jgi:hypothetical protein